MDKPKTIEKVYAFIDSQNLNLGVKDQDWALDFKRFHKYLVDKYNISTAILFIGYIETNTRLYEKLESYGYKIIFKPTIEFGSGKKTVKGNVDAELVLHAMIELNNYDKAIIISGDGDFRCLVEYLVSINKLLKIFIPNKRNFSALLRKYLPYMVFLEDIKNKVEYKKWKAVPRYD